MCIVFFAKELHPDYPIIAAFNRDEEYNREAAQAEFWKDAPIVLAGRDLSSSGTWGGVSKRGRFGFLTNYRDPKLVKAHAKSRGELVSEFLKSSTSANEYLRNSVQPRGDDFNPFNLLIGDENESYYYSNVTNEIQAIPKGFYGLSNHLLNTDWMKVRTGRAWFEEYLKQQQRPAVEDFLEILSNSDQAPDADLPDTGIDKKIEKLISPIFIHMPGYGTRVSSVLLISATGKIEFFEKTHVPIVNEPIRKFAFQID
jgi:uncharacterized protein with NRDE domain